MDTRRLNSWLEGSAALPESGTVGVFNAWPDIDLAGIARDRLRAVQPFAPDHATLTMRGVETATLPDASYDAVVLRLPREKDRAQSYLSDALRRTPQGAPIVVDGQKTDGVESLLKLCKARFKVREVISKAHGKLFWFDSTGTAEGLGFPQLRPELKSFGFHTAPGVFSADGPDKGSVALAAELPELTGRVADLGAGWGYLSARILENAHPDELHLVEADWLALASARQNVTHPAARFHWADATTWRPDGQFDAIVMNPPFHVGRQGTPALGQAFIHAAAGLLAAKGVLWLVANRHLPYETTLDEAFREVREIGDLPGFKIFCGARPRAR